MHGSIRPILVLGALAAAGSAAGVSAAGPLRSGAATRCGTVSGAAWSIKEAGGPITGSTYTVGAEGVPCTLALKSVPGLTRKTGSGVGGPVTGGPAGFQCRSFATSASGDKLVYSGVCLKPPGSISFSWTVKTRSK